MRYHISLDAHCCWLLGNNSARLYLKINSARLVFEVAKYWMTFSLKSPMLEINSFSVDIIANPVNLSFTMVDRKKVLILLRVEKHLSASADVIGVVIKILSKFTVFGNSDWR